MMLDPSRPISLIATTTCETCTPEPRVGSKRWDSHGSTGIRPARPTGAPWAGRPKDAMRARPAPPVPRTRTSRPVFSTNRCPVAVERATQAGVDSGLDPGSAVGAQVRTKINLPVNPRQLGDLATRCRNGSAMLPKESFPHDRGASADCPARCGLWAVRVGSPCATHTPRREGNSCTSVSVRSL